MAVRSEEIASIIKQQIQQFGTDVAAVNVGTVIAAGDGIARINGLSNVAASELVEFPTGVMGLALNLEEDSVGVMVLGSYDDIKEGDEVRATGRIVEVPVGDALLGRVVDALGQPIDGRGPIATTKTRPVERIAPDVTTRKGVDTTANGDFCVSPASVTLLFFAARTGTQTGVKLRALQSIFVVAMSSARL